MINITLFLLISSLSVIKKTHYIPTSQPVYLGLVSFDLIYRINWLIFFLALSLMSVNHGGLIEKRTGVAKKEKKKK